MSQDARLLVGIDIGKDSADYALLHPNGQVLVKDRPFVNSQEGFEQAKAWLLQTLQRQGLGGLDLAVEATSYYWLPLYIQLSQDPDLALFHPRLSLLNAGWVKWYKKSFPPDHKSDRADPFYIADRLRTLSQPIWWSYDAHWLPLRFQTRLRFHFSQSLTREKNHYLLFLFLAYSGYTRLKPFSDPFGQLSQTLLSHPEELLELCQWPLAELAAELDERSHHRLKDPQGVAQRLQQALQESFPLPSELDPILHNLLGHLAETIRFLHQQIQSLDEQIAGFVQSGYPEVAWLDSVPGVGPVFSSGMAAEIGGLQRFTTPPKWDGQRQAYRPRTGREVEDAVAKFTGLWWPQNASGSFQAEETPLSKRGNAYLRYYVLLAADRMRLLIPSYQAFYAKKYAEASKHQQKRALVLTGRKALGLFVGLLQHQESYRPEEGEPTCD